MESRFIPWIVTPSLYTSPAAHQQPPFYISNYKNPHHFYSLKYKNHQNICICEYKTQSVQMFPDSTDAYAARAAFETQQAQYDAALYDWDEALRLAPKNAELTASKVDVLLRLGRKKEAREALDQAVKQGTPRAALREWYDKCK